VLRLLRNPVYIGKISHDETVHEGKHDAIIDEAIFARAQDILNTRAAESTAVAPTTSDYLLTGLVRCLACDGAYIGVSANGRRNTYRYYICRTRQVTGTRGCTGHRVPADDLEAAVMNELRNLYSNLDLFEEAIEAAFEHIENEHPRLEAELAGIDAQVRDVTVAIDRYLRAFEAGTMPEAICAPRLAELTDRRAELAAHRDRPELQLRSTAPSPPSRQELERLAQEALDELTGGNPEQIKQALAALVDRVEITPDRHARPFFRVPSETNRPGPRVARANRTPVRIGLHQVEVRGVEPLCFGGSSRLLRAQPAAVFSAPAISQASRCGLSHCLIFLPTP
jgi:site-specific DNA recombinase